MKVPLLDLRSQLATLEDEIKGAVEEVIESTQYILGPRVEAFERAVADYLGVAHAVGVSSGTDALLASLMALGVGPGDRVITTPYTFFATAGSIVRVGAEPVFVDIDPVSYNIDPGAVSAWLNGHPELCASVKGIIPVHLFGQCADMDAIMEVAANRGIAVIEDAAQAIGVDYPSSKGSKRAGSIGDLGCFSFFPSKNLGGIGDGGLVVTNDEQLGQRVRRIRAHGSHPRYHHAMIGGNFRLDPIQAAVLAVKLPHLDRWNAMRRERAAYYDHGARLADLGIVPPRAVNGEKHHIYHQYVVGVAAKRDELQKFLTDNEVATGMYYPLSLHEQECFATLGYRRGDLPHSEYAAEHTIALPMYPELTPLMQDFVVETIKKFHV